MKALKVLKALKVFKNLKALKALMTLKAKIFKIITYIYASAYAPAHYIPPFLTPVLRTG